MTDNSVGPGSDLLADEDGKTVEDLLAELGPEDSWDISKDEESQIRELLRSAHQDLRSNQAVSNETSEDSKHEANSSISQSSDTQTLVQHSQSMQPKSAGIDEEQIDQEADEYLAQVLEELRYQPEQDQPENPRDRRTPEPSQEKAARDQQSPTGVDLPQAPDNDIEPPPSYTETTADDDLASRFASLGLPSVPKTIKTAPNKPPATKVTQPTKDFTDEEIDSWCIICNEDATLRCIGCDGDLYCTSCWLDGHKGADAGYEERTHKAIQFNKGGGMKKQPARRTMLGA